MDRKSPEYKAARKARRIARKAKALGISVEEYQLDHGRSKLPAPGKHMDLPDVMVEIYEPQAKHEFSEIEAREKSLKKLATSAMAKRLIARTGQHLTDRAEIIRALLINEFEDEQNEGFVEAYYTSN